MRKYLKEILGLTVLVLVISSGNSIARELQEQEPLDNFQLQVYLTEAQALSLVFPDGVEIAVDEVVPVSEEKRLIENRLKRRLYEDRFKVYIGRKKGKVKGYAIICEEIGKFHPFTFIVGVKPNGKISQVAVLVYRESRGNEIARKRFLYQFVGKKTKHPVRINKDIINITGATMSVNAMCAGVRKSLVVIDEVDLSGKRDPLLATLPLYNPESTQELEKQGGHGVTLNRLLMGTVAEITAYGDNSEKVENAINLALDEINRLDWLMSTYKKESELSRVNREAATVPTTCDNELVDIIEDSIRYSILTGGAFDCTVSPLVKLWRQRGGRRLRGVEGDITQVAFHPSTNEINAAMSAVSYKNIIISGSGNSEEREISFKNPQTRIDLGAIGKGYAVDRAFDVLKENGIANACINFGGNIRVMGSPPGSDAWKIAVQHPREKDSVLGYLKLTGGAISTSGDYEKFFTIDGKRYSHIIDPRVGKPVEGMVSVTVIAKTATQADALSTGAFVLSCKKGLGLIEEIDGAEAILVYEDEDAHLHQDMSNGFSLLFQQERT